MALFGSKSQKSGGIMDMIRCDEPSHLIWKWHPAGSKTNNNDRENAIRWGSSLRVKDGEVAVFVYKQKDGSVQDFIVGPFDQIIKTFNLPILSDIIGLAYDGGTPFQAEVYFINLAHVIQIKFGVPFFDVYDPRFLDFGVPIAVRGTLSFHISDYRQFIKLHRLINFDLSSFQNQIRDAISNNIKAIVSNVPADYDIPVIQIERKTAQIAEIAKERLAERLSQDFGVKLSGLDISAIEPDKNSAGYKQLMRVTKDIVSANVEAQAAVNIKQMQDKQRIEAENYKETLRIQREEAQYAQHLASETSNFAAFQTEAQRDVGLAGAEALGKMNANNAGNVTLGNNSGFNPAAMMAGIALGGAIGQNITNTMNAAVTGINNPVNNSTSTPPPIPSTTYHVVINGQAAGPFDMSVLAQMASSGMLTQDSLVWRQGMSEWAAAKIISELQTVFSSVPPVPPTIPSESNS